MLYISYIIVKDSELLKPCVFTWLVVLGNCYSLTYTLYFFKQTQVIAAASASFAAESLTPKDAKAGVENAAQLSVFLVENTTVILMLVEDHLRLQSKQNCAASAVDVSPSPLSLVYPLNNRSRTLPTVAESEVSSSRASVSSDSGGVHLDVSGNYSYLRINMSPCLLAYFLFVYITSFKKR